MQQVVVLTAILTYAGHARRVHKKGGMMRLAFTPSTGASLGSEPCNPTLTTSQRSVSSKPGQPRLPEGRGRPARMVATLERLQRKAGMGDVAYEWQPQRDLWEEAYGRLEKFKKRHGHCNVPPGHETKDGFPLGDWLILQRRRLNPRANLWTGKQSHRKRLEALGLAIWEQRDRTPDPGVWDANYRRLLAYKAEHGNCEVPIKYITDDGWRLGQWVRLQRKRLTGKFRSGLDETQSSRLNALGFNSSLRLDWHTWYKYLEEYKMEHGDCRVHRNYVTPTGRGLGRWVENMKRKSCEGTLPAAQRESLEELGMQFDTTDWMRACHCLESYKSEFGSCNVPLNYETEDVQLGLWVKKQREQYQANTLSKTKEKRLETVGLLKPLLEVEFLEGYACLQVYKAEHGNCYVPHRFVTEGGQKLGEWLRLQHRKAKKRLLPSSHRLLLEDVGLDWAKSDKHSLTWDQWCMLLETYKAEHGNCDVPFEYVTKGGHWLGRWATRQIEANLTESRRSKLSELGLKLLSPLSHWQKMYRALQEYHAEHGDCKVPRNYTTYDGYNLFIWQWTQRTTRRELTEEQRSQLESVEFQWEHHSKAWEEGFRQLEEYRAEHGDCNVSQSFVMADGYRLGNWVSRQRLRFKGRWPGLTDSQRSRLEALGFIPSVPSAAWDKGFRHLQEYHALHGNCSMLTSYVTADGYPLGRWVNEVRLKTKAYYKRTNATKVSLLTSLKFTWSVHDEMWERGFSKLGRFKSRTGHCEVPTWYVNSDGFHLGKWVRRQVTLHKMFRRYRHSKRWLRLKKLGLKR
mmetsp:Transcript_1050/g.1879  ORF Transcript_1050/g.1879 Transcript_1050/m.1879 type:complete len:797 (+) Transcript_1050:104-2494(+)